MRKKDFARRLAHEAHVTPAVAADQIDSVVTQLLRRLKEGKPAEIPGFGTLLPGEAITFKAEEKE
jgi:nucleoid DNA-binding protein